MRKEALENASILKQRKNKKSNFCFIWVLIVFVGLLMGGVILADQYFEFSF